MEAMGHEVERGHLGVRDVLAFRVGAAIELTAHAQPGRGAGGADEIDDHRETHERLAAPVGADVREESVLDLVPLAGPRRKVTDGDRQPRTIGQPLQFPFPQPHARAIAAAGVRGDEQRARAPIAGPAHLAPPSSDRLGREGRRVVINAHTDPPRVAREIVDPIGNRLAALRDEEVMDPHRLGLARRPPLSSRVLEVADQLFLLGIDGDDRLPGALSTPHLLVDVPELRVAIRMIRPLARLAIGLQTVTRRGQELGDQLPADGVAHALERLRQVTHALRCPAQRGLGMSRRGRLHQPFEIGPQGRILRQHLLAAAARSPNPLWRNARGRGQLLEAASNRGVRDSCGARHHRDAAAPCRPGLRRGPHPAGSLRQRRGQGLVLLPAERDVHSSSVATVSSNSFSYFLTLPKLGSLLMVLSILSGCATASEKASKSPVAASINTETCLEKLQGYWQGAISHNPAAWWPGGPNRTLLIYVINGNVLADYGITGYRLDPVKVSVYVPDTGCKVRISFLTPVNSRVTLDLYSDNWLQGTFVDANSPPKNFKLQKRK